MEIKPQKKKSITDYFRSGWEIEAAMKKAVLEAIEEDRALRKIRLRRKRAARNPAK